MRVVDIIEKKRDGKVLTDEEIKFLLNNYLSGNIPDYQISAFLMAVYFKGMNDSELKAFTTEMINSGDTIDFQGAHKFLVDKHSTGGVGDKTTIALAPVLAALGMGTAKLSGKGLGHTGGTIDKFESIKGFKFSETREELIKLVNETGIGIMGYSEKIVPMDKKLYSLRDVTGTVSSIPLIASSIMSKKLAVHADAIILDVKVGSGAFMKTFEEAKKLAETMHKLGKLFNRNIVCMLSNMDEPLGCAVGNSLEVIEAIETLKGRGPKKFKDLIVKLSAQALKMKGDVKTLEEGIIIVEEVITSGRALENLENFIKASGGNPKICRDYSLLEVAKEVTPYLAAEEGYISHIAADEIGRAAMMLGAGRSTKEDIIDHSVGLIMNAKIGTYVKKGDNILDFYHKGNLTENIVEIVKSSIKYSKEKVEEKEIILEIIGG
ncbi:MAG: thymidine phosphorylase [Fusobacteriaceae bacterium]